MRNVVSSELNTVECGNLLRLVQHSWASKLACCAGCWQKSARFPPVPTVPPMAAHQAGCMEGPVDLRQTSLQALQG